MKNRNSYRFLQLLPEYLCHRYNSVGRNPILFHPIFVFHVVAVVNTDVYKPTALDLSLSQEVGGDAISDFQARLQLFRAAEAVLADTVRADHRSGTHIHLLVPLEVVVTQVTHAHTLTCRDAQ